MASTRPVEWRKRARRLRLAGIVVLVAAAVLIITANVLGGLLVGVLGVGNMIAAKEFAATGEIPRQAQVLVLVGGTGFVVVMSAVGILALMRG